ncbi:MAG: biotin carboxyl carrier protein [Candidatus Deianiraeaceae bacterium]
MAGKNNINKYIILTALIIFIVGVYFAFGTTTHSPEKDFQQEQASNIISNTQKIKLRVKNSTANLHPETIQVFGKIDQNAITVRSSISSTIKYIKQEGRKLKKGTSVVTFINGVSLPMPFKGTLLNTFAKEGENINSGDKLFIALPSKSHSINIDLDIPIIYTSRIKNGMEVQIDFQSKSYKGEIIFMSKSINEAVGIVKATATMPYKSLPHNTTVKTKIVLQQHLSHYIPKTALILQSNHPSVKIITNNVVEEKAISIIDENTNGFYITGLNDKEIIITRNPAYAKNGNSYEYSDGQESNQESTLDNNNGE